MFLRRKDIVQGTDEELISSSKAGDQCALGGLWDRYAHLLYGVAMKYMKEPEVAKDMVVELFTDLPGMFKVHTIGKFRPWVHTVMRNRCLQELRKLKRLEPLEAIQWSEADATEEQQLHEYDLQKLEQAIERLDRDQRVCVTLFHLEQNSYKQIAEITGMTTEKVRSHIQNGRRNLRIELQRNALRSA
jgi:RNA polymerase sigma-70 factor (ECF subfamily)